MRNLLLLMLGGSLLLSAPASFSATSPAIVELQTNIGTIAIQLDYANAPITANNFITYVKNGFYKNTVFHRIIKGFMMQGGGVNKFDGQFKTAIAAPIVNESTNGLSNLTGTIAMARTDDPNSATSQFFINFVDNKFLDYTDAANPGYAVFGKVISARSMNVVKKVESLANFNNVAFTNSANLVTIDAVYTSANLIPSQSFTRISLNGLGKVVSTPAGINCGSACVLSQSTGSAMTLTATAAAGYYFSGWRGDCSGFRRILKLDTTRGNHNCTAVFSPLGAVTQ